MPTFLKRFIQLFFVTCLFLSTYQSDELKEKLKIESNYEQQTLKFVLSKYRSINELSADSSFRLISSSDYLELESRSEKSYKNQETSYLLKHDQLALSFYLLIFFVALSFLVLLFTRTTIYKNFRISYKLASGFSFVIFVAVVIAIVGAYSLKNVKNEADLSVDISKINILATEFETLQYKFVTLGKKDLKKSDEIFLFFKEEKARYLKILSKLESKNLIPIEQKMIETLKVKIEDYSKNFINIKKSFHGVELLKKSLYQNIQDMRKIFEHIIELHEIELENLEFAEKIDDGAIYLQSLLVEDLFRAETWLLKVRLQENGFVLDKNLVKVNQLEDTIVQLVDRLNQLENTIYKSPASKKVKDESNHQLEKLRKILIQYNNSISALIRETFVLDSDLKDGEFSLKQILSNSMIFAKGAEEKRAYVQKEAMVSAVLLLVIALISGFLCSRSITISLRGPIQLALKFFHAVLEGDISKRVEIHSNDEIGEMIESINLMADCLQEHADVAYNISDGHLDNKIAILSESDVFGKSLTSMQNKLFELVENVTNSSVVVETGATQISEACQHLADGINSSSANLEEVSVTMHGVGEQTVLNAKSAIQANEITSNACDAASHGSKQMDTLIVAIQEIHESASSISKIIKTIEDIAFQTNLLALNAAIEAARAGVHGKGFAVVAEEVRSLAGRSAKAVTETAELISLSNEKIVRGTKIAEETAQALDKIVDDIDSSALLVSQIAKSSNDQSDSINQANVALTKISDVMLSNSSSVEQTAAQSQELFAEVKVLSSLLKYYNSNMNEDEQIDLEGLALSQIEA